MKVAVVGLGYWGPNLVRNLIALELCDDIIACDLDPMRVVAVQKRFPSVIPMMNYSDLLTDRDVAAVVLATPVHTHFRLAMQALEAGKCVLVEKPLASSSEYAERLIDFATEKGLLVVAGHTFLFSAAVQFINQLIRSGEIGDPLYIQSSRVNLGIHQPDVSVLWDLAPHDLSIVMHWIDERPIRVSATGRASLRGRPPDVAFVDLEFPSGIIANLHLSWLAPTKVRRTTLVATRKMVVYEDTNTDEPVKVYDSGVSILDPEDFAQRSLMYRTGDVVSPRIETWEPLRAELSEFLQRVQAGDRPDARESQAVDVVRIVEMAEQSLTSGGTPILLGDRMSLDGREFNIYG